MRTQQIEPTVLRGDDARRRLRGRNIAVALALLAWVVLIYVITMVKMGGG